MRSPLAFLVLVVSLLVSAPASADFIGVWDRSFTIDFANGNVRATGDFDFTRLDPTGNPEAATLSYVFDARVSGVYVNVEPGVRTQSVLTYDDGSVELRLNGNPFVTLDLDFATVDVEQYEGMGPSRAISDFVFESLKLSNPLRSVFEPIPPEHSWITPIMSFSWTPGAGPSFPLIDSPTQYNTLQLDVPEPSLLAILPLGLAALGVRRRRRT